MNFDIKTLIDTLIEGSIIYLSSLSLTLTLKQQKLLRIDLFDELSKNFELQKRNPTQIANDFLNKQFQLDLNLTPSDFGEKAKFQIILWGLSKVESLKENY